MTEILTESFCERCGTRYTFESTAPRQKRLGGLKVIGRGLKNFVLSDDSSLDEAFAAARSDAEHDATAHQLDAFHATFNFCMSCRQYTCANCWNEAEARCLSCAPLTSLETLTVLETEIDPERLLRFLGTATRGAPAASEEPVAADHVHAAELIGDEVHEAELIAEATAAARQAELDREAGVAAAAAALVAEAAASARQAELDREAEAAAAAAGVVAEAAPSAMAEPEAAPKPDMAAEAQPVAGAQAGEELTAEDADQTGIGEFEPGLNIDDAIAAYEASVATEALATDAFAAAGEPAAVAEALGEPEVEPPAVAAAAVESPAAPEMEPVAAQVAEEAAEEAAAPQLKPVAEPEPEPEPVAAKVPVPEAQPTPASPGVDVIDQPVWPAAAAQAPAPEWPAEAPAAPTGPPSWPTGPRWPTALPALPALPAPPPATPGNDPLAALMARTSTEAMWAASSRDVLQPIAAAATVAAVQPCTNCGISLSATARFCRRCGTPQG